MTLTGVRVAAFAAVLAAPLTLIAPSAQADPWDYPVQDNCASATKYCTFTATGPSGFVPDPRFPDVFPSISVTRPDGSGWYCWGYAMFGWPGLPPWWMTDFLWTWSDAATGMHAGVGVIGAGDKVRTSGLLAGRDFPIRLPEGTPRNPVPPSWNSGCYEHGPSGDSR